MIRPMGNDRTRRAKARCRLVIFAMLCAYQRVSAQSVEHPMPPCSDSAAAGESYNSCALRLDGHGLRRGADGQLIARRSFFRPVPLSRFVGGDRARASALEFERYERASLALSAVSIALVLGLDGVALMGHCHLFPGGTRQCSDGNSNHAAIVNGLLVGSCATEAISLSLTVRASRAGNLAVWWHNSRLSR